MPTTSGYDPKKAATYNKLRQAGLSEDAAIAQAGISDADFGSYAIGSNGQMGAIVAGGGKVAGVDYDPLTPAERAESARFEKGLQSPNFETVSYPEKASAPPGAVKPITYTTTSTETVSGGGETTIVNRRVPNDQSRALQSEVDAKQAELNQFNKDNPSNFARKRQGLPPLSPEEELEQSRQRLALEKEAGAARNKQIDAETPVASPATTTPNTTTTTQTVTTTAAGTNEPVDPANDQKLAQENETQLEATPSAATGTTTREPTAVEPQTTVNEFGEVVAVEAPEPVEDPFEAERLRAEQSLSDPEPTLAPEDVGEEDPFEARRLELEQEQNREELAQTATEPEPVDAGQDPGLRTPDGEEEGEIPSETGLREPTEEDVAAAEQNAAKTNTINQATLQARYKQPGIQDWRVRISLSDKSTYLYKNTDGPGILAPLAKTDGVIFPYTPSIETSYVANYDKYDLVHSNYRGAYYKNSAVNDISIRGIFTAQDTSEAQYMLAVIHFFRSVTKMFYGKDEQRGAPPPLVYLSGFGDYQFAGHPCVVTNFSYSLPSDVDYIRANNPNNYGTDLLNRRDAALSSPTAFSGQNARQAILAAVGIPFGATPSKPTPGPVSNSVTNTARATYVPTKIEINVTLLPMQTRDQVSKQFSLKDFANGKLIQGGFW
jgi:hypothetical protein